MSLRASLLSVCAGIIMSVLACMPAHAGQEELFFDDVDLEPFVLPEQQVDAIILEEEFYRGEVVEIIDERQEEFGPGGSRPIVQTFIIRLLSGPDTGRELEIEYGAITEEQKLQVGQKVVVVNPGAAFENRFYLFDVYRLTAIFLILGLFIALVVLAAGWRGIASVAGLGVSILVLALFVVPQIIAGRNPLVISLIGSFVIGTLSIYLAHGFSRRTSVAVVSTLTTIVLAIGLAVAFVSFVQLTGSGSDEAFFLQSAPVEHINLRGLLLGGIIIGALGVLDDITTGQAAAVDEIWKANPKLSRRELFARAFSVGREHIIALVNTLALAYVGASLPALLLFTVYQRPWWVVANTETIAEEVIRTLVGSVALMAAVPITTLLAAYFLPGRDGGAGEEEGHSHGH
jgi:uncharacterized membrane protein